MLVTNLLSSANTLVRPWVLMKKRPSFRNSPPPPSHPQGGFPRVYSARALNPHPLPSRDQSPHELLIPSSILLFPASGPRLSACISTFYARFSRYTVNNFRGDKVSAENTSRRERAKSKEVIPRERKSGFKAKGGKRETNFHREREKRKRWELCE